MIKMLPILIDIDKCKRKRKTTQVESHGHVLMERKQSRFLSNRFTRDSIKRERERFILTHLIFHQMILCIDFHFIQQTFHVEIASLSSTARHPWR